MAGVEANSQYRVSKPANVKLHATLSGLSVFWLVAIPRLVKVAIERDANLALLLILEVSLVRNHSAGVAQNLSVPGCPGLRC